MYLAWMKQVNKPYDVVGHRGLPQRFPENTIRGVLAAAEAGASFIEIDVQISADGVPMVFHDETLLRTAARKGHVWDYSAEQLQSFSAHEPERLGEQFAPEPVATLQALCLALEKFPVTVFVEVKAESLSHISREKMLQVVIEATRCIADRVIFISFDYEIVTLAKQHFPIGWALRAMDVLSREKAERLLPDVLIYNVKFCERDVTFWPGPWRWFLYDIVDRDEAQFWANKGVSFIETWDVTALL